MAKPDETPTPVESLPAMRAAGSRHHGVSRTATYAITGAALAGAAIVIILVIKPWAIDRNTKDPEPVVDDPVQVKFDLERQPAKIVAELGLTPGSRVADIGADTGLLTVHLARAVNPGGKVVATDIDAGVLGLLQNRIAKAKLTDLVETRVVPKDRPDLEPGIYDAILLSQVDNLFKDPVEWLVAAKSALKPGGRIVIVNLLHHRAKGIAAAKHAGLELVKETTPTSRHYLAVFTAK